MNTWGHRKRTSKYHYAPEEARRMDTLGNKRTVALIEHLLHAMMAHSILIKIKDMERFNALTALQMKRRKKNSCFANVALLATGRNVMIGKPWQIY